MTISIQLVEIPDNEQVANRQVVLPSAGGTIGRSYDCTLTLSDYGRTLSRQHLEISRASDGSYRVTDLSSHGSLLNQAPLQRGIAQRLADGDILKIAGYTLLVSDLSEPQQDSELLERDSLGISAEKFDATNIGLNDPIDSAEEALFEAMDSPVASAFNADNVMLDDPFGYDPFEDDLAMQPQQAPQELAATPVAGNGEIQVAGDQDQQLSQGLAQLQQLITQQQQWQHSSLQHDKLLDCIHQALDKFLEEFDPATMQSEFDDYISGWGSRDKRYWKLYQKKYQRKRDKGEYQQQFAALFMDALRGRND